MRRVRSAHSGWGVSEGGREGVVVVLVVVVALTDALALWLQG